MNALKLKIDKAMQREYEMNPERHELLMIKRIVKYAIKKHKDCQ